MPDFKQLSRSVKGLTVLVTAFVGAIGLFIETPYIGTTMCSEEDRFRANMVIGVEAFVSRSGVGSAGLEQNFIVHEERHEILTKTPMIWW